MKRPQLKRMTIVIAVCAVVGAIAGIAGSAAAPTSSSSTSTHTRAQKKALKQAFEVRARGLKKGAVRLGFGPGLVGPGFGFGPVHAEAVIPKPDGSGFFTVTTDAGTLNSVDGTTVHLKEGTDKATYKADAAIDVGSSAQVRRNGQAAKLSDLKPGDHVRVITGAPKANLVIAEDSAFLAQQMKKFDQFKKQFKKQFRERRFRHGAFHFGLGPGSPPQGAESGGSNG
jgi:hypothetical protein